MRGRLFTTVLLASALAACGSDSHNTANPPRVAQVGANAAAVTTPAAAPHAKKQVQIKKTARTTHQALRPTHGYVSPAVRLKTTSGKAPAVVILANAGEAASAQAEAQALGRLGVAALVVRGRAPAQSSSSGIEVEVARLLAGISKLAKEPGIDKTRIGVVAEGPAAHAGAVAVGRAPDAITAAVLIDVGGPTVSNRYTPERWLSRAPATRVLLQQQDASPDALTRAEITRLMVAAPPGTLLQHYRKLNGQARVARDTWLKNTLLSD